MSDQSFTPIFDDLPEQAKPRLKEESLNRKDWKRCTVCKVHDGNKKLLACTQCRPFILSPVYYCSRKCQRADWPQHKASCVKLARDAIPISREKLESGQFSLQRQVENWAHIHTVNIRRFMKQFFYFRASFEPRLNSVLIHLHIHDATSDPPRLWPSKIELVPKVGQIGTHWFGQGRDLGNYTFLFAGRSTAMFFPYEDEFGEGWRSEMEAKGEVYPAYDLMFLNLFLACPQTKEVSELQWLYIQWAIKVGQELHVESALGELPSPFVMFDRQRSMDNSSRVLKLVQSNEWLQLFKMTRIWERVDELGYLKTIRGIFD